MNIEPGSSTAFPFNVHYRIGRISKYIDGGSWLDLGCADGGYSAALLEAGAASVIGIDVEEDRVEAARQAHPDITFQVSDGGRLALDDSSFNGVFMNEVFEHVEDEGETLDEVRRILKPGGHLIVISPNRGFPFEGHRIQIGRWSSERPTPIIPWLPRSTTDRWVTARNYWPGELRAKIENRGYKIVETGFIMPVFEAYPWIPEAVSQRFRDHVTSIDRWPGIRRLGVSNLVVGQRQD